MITRACSSMEERLSFVRQEVWVQILPGSPMKATPHG